MRIKTVAAAFGVTITAEHDADSLSETKLSSALLARESASLMLRDRNDVPRVVCETSDGFLVSGDRHAILIGLDGEAAMREFDDDDEVTNEDEGDPESWPIDESAKVPAALSRLGKFSFKRSPMGSQPWMTGTTKDGKFKIDALVFDTPSYYGINAGRVSKLYVTAVTDGKSDFRNRVVSYDREWEQKPTSADAKKIVKAFLQAYPETEPEEVSSRNKFEAIEESVDVQIDTESIDAFLARRAVLRVSTRLRSAYDEARAADDEDAILEAAAALAEAMGVSNEFDAHMAKQGYKSCPEPKTPGRGGSVTGKGSGGPGGTTGARMGEAYDVKARAAVVKADYEKLRKTSVADLRAIWKRSHKVGDPKGTDKAGLIADILRGRHGGKAVDVAFEDGAIENGLMEATYNDVKGESMSFTNYETGPSVDYDDFRFTPTKNGVRVDSLHPSTGKPVWDAGIIQNGKLVSYTSSGRTVRTKSPVLDAYAKIKSKLKESQKAPDVAATLRRLGAHASVVALVNRARRMASDADDYYDMLASHPRVSEPVAKKIAKAIPWTGPHEDLDEDLDEDYGDVSMQFNPNDFIQRLSGFKDRRAQVVDNDIFSDIEGIIDTVVHGPTGKRARKLIHSEVLKRMKADRRIADHLAARGFNYASESEDTDGDAGLSEAGIIIDLDEAPKPRVSHWVVLDRTMVGSREWRVDLNTKPRTNIKAAVADAEAWVKRIGKQPGGMSTIHGVAVVSIEGSASQTPALAAAKKGDFSAGPWTSPTSRVSESVEDGVRTEALDEVQYTVAVVGKKAVTDDAIRNRIKQLANKLGGQLTRDRVITATFKGDAQKNADAFYAQAKSIISAQHDTIPTEETDMTPAQRALLTEALDAGSLMDAKERIERALATSRAADLGESKLRASSIDGALVRQSFSSPEAYVAYIEKKHGSALSRDQKAKIGAAYDVLSKQGDAKDKLGDASWVLADIVMNVVSGAPLGMSTRQKMKGLGVSKIKGIFESAEDLDALGDLDEAKISVGDDVTYNGQMGVVLRVKGSIARVRLAQGDEELPISDLKAADVYTEGEGDVLDEYRADIDIDEELDDDEREMILDIIDALYDLYGDDVETEEFEFDEVVEDAVIDEVGRRKTAGEKRKNRLAAKRRSRGRFKVPASVRRKLARSAKKLAKSSKGKKARRRAVKTRRMYNSVEIPKSRLNSFLSEAKRLGVPPTASVNIAGDTVTISLPEDSDFDLSTISV